MVKARREAPREELVRRPGETDADFVRRIGKHYLTNPTLQQIIEARGVKPLKSLNQLAIPELAGEDIDELLAIIRELRGKS